jgi:hypothetical protein
VPLRSIAKPRRSLAVLAVLLAISSIALCAELNQPVLLKARLETYLTSYTSKRGFEFQAVVIAPYKQNGRIVIPRDSQVIGVVRRATRVGLGLRHERARLDLLFYEIRMPDGRRFPFNAKLVSIDNARETVDPHGEIEGILAARYPDGLLGGVWYKADATMTYRSLFGLTGVANMLWQNVATGPFGAVALVALRCALLSFPEPEIHLPPGADLNLAVQIAPGSFPSYPVPQAPEVPPALGAWLDDQPRELTRPKGAAPDDMINVAFVGSREQIEHAFKESGWSVPERPSVRSFTHFYAAFNAMRPYSRAPVSRLLYRGAPPDLIFERSLNTVSKRDHVRIWRVGSFENQQVWLGAAIHDRGIGFRLATFKFTHEIDDTIDSERTDVVNDLAFAGCSQSVSYVVPSPSSSRLFILNNRLETDGRIAVVFLSQCSEPSQAAAGPMPKPPGNKVTRLTRRLILETRNYVLRDNAYYWTFEFIKWKHSEYRAGHPRPGTPEQSAPPPKDVRLAAVAPSPHESTQ